MRVNIRLLKALRRVSDQRLADDAGFNSRQMVADRIGERTPISIPDLCSFAATLGVAPAVLLGDKASLMVWLDENPDYRPPSPKRARKKAAQ